jgi:hypothetical protein
MRHIEAAAKLGHGSGLLCAFCPQIVVHGCRKQADAIPGCTTDTIKKNAEKAGGVAASRDRDQQARRSFKPVEETASRLLRRQNDGSSGGYHVGAAVQQARRFCSLPTFASTAFGALG